MDDALDVRRKRLRFRAWHRGTKESDIILGRFADAHLGDLDVAELDAFEELLDLPDPEIFDWVSGRVPVPEPLRGPLMDRLLAFRLAQPG